MSQLPWQALLEQLERAWRGAGLDLLHPFAVADYNSRVVEAERLQDFGRPRALGLLVGNTRALWPAFSDALTRDQLLAGSRDPLDLYVTASIERALSRASELRHHSYFSHVTTPRALPIQRLAELVGFAALSPSHLAIHAVHGPWFALRAVVTVDVEGPSSAAAAAARPCDGCAEPCVPALQRALAASGSTLDSSSVAAHAADWIAVRDACPVGKASRYGGPQLRYHYGVDRKLLRHGS